MEMETSESIIQVKELQKRYDDFGPVADLGTSFVAQCGEIFGSYGLERVDDHH